MTTDLTSLVTKMLTQPEPVYEPEPRNKDGMRFIRHRFPIKGGITYREVLSHTIERNNALYRRLKAMRAPA